MGNTLVIYKVIGGVHRITPIHMGNTYILTDYDDFIKDHPHTHGEYGLNLGQNQANMGSPPYTWGIH